MKNKCTFLFTAANAAATGAGNGAGAEAASRACHMQLARRTYGARTRAAAHLPLPVLHALGSCLPLASTFRFLPTLLVCIVLLCCCFASPASASIVLIVVVFARSAALFECMSRIIFKQVFACVNTFRSLRIMPPPPLSVLPPLPCTNCCTLLLMRCPTSSCPNCLTPAASPCCCCCCFFRLLPAHPLPTAWACACIKRCKC